VRQGITNVFNWICKRNEKQWGNQIQFSQGYNGVVFSATRFIIIVSSEAAFTIPILDHSNIVKARRTYIALFHNIPPRSHTFMSWVLPLSCSTKFTSWLSYHAVQMHSPYSVAGPNYLVPPDSQSQAYLLPCSTKTGHLLPVRI
jgi:hypothetical protein